MHRLVKAHWLKTRKTPFRWVLICLPLIYSVLLFSYFFAAHQSYVNVQTEFTDFFLLLTLAIQFMSGIVVVLFNNLDKKAGCFGNEIRIGVPRVKLILSKVIFLFLCLIAVALLAIFSFVVLQGVFRGFWPNLVQTFSYLFFMVLLLLPQLVVYVWTSYQFGLTGTLVVAILSFLTGVLMGTTAMGGGLWRFIPPTWPARVIYGILPASWELSAEYQQMALQQLLTLIPATIILSAVLIFMLIIWYNRWEGTQNMEE